MLEKRVKVWIMERMNDNKEYFEYLEDDRKMDMKECQQCKKQHENAVKWSSTPNGWEGNMLGPTHEGAPSCRSGSIASGGNRAHCACRACW